MGIGRRVMEEETKEKGNKGDRKWRQRRNRRSDLSSPKYPYSVPERFTDASRTLHGRSQNSETIVPERFQLTDWIDESSRMDRENTPNG
jgi:hypothetical protein